MTGLQELIETTDYRELPFSTSFRAFIRQRARIVAMFRSLPRSDWSRSAMIIERARTRERTVAEYADWLARHEARHVDHFERFGRKIGRSMRLARRSDA